MFVLVSIDHYCHIHKRKYQQKDDQLDLYYHQLLDSTQQHKFRYLDRVLKHGTKVCSCLVWI